MKLSYVWKSLAFLLGLLLLIFIICLLMIPGQKTYSSYSLPDDLITLDQNWNANIRQQMHYAGFGSKLLPYEIFTNLELADSDALLSDTEVLDGLGFITQKPGPDNPAGLPVGFAIEKSDGEDWVGLTCTACHTGMVTYEGKRLLLEGGPGLLNFAEFEYTVAKAVSAATEQSGKFTALAERMELTSDTDRQNLRDALQERNAFFDELLMVNAVTVPYGYGRLDAFGRIFNAVSTMALGVPENRHAPDAPVSIPMLWDASHLDLVQWNASAPNKNPGPLGQNVTTALAVYGQIDMSEGMLGYPSSVNIKNLGYIQSQYFKLRAPVWPENILGKIDREKAAVGEEVYEQHCLSCHSIAKRDRKDSRLRAKVVPLEVVNTDPVMATNFARLKSATGWLEGERSAVLAGERFADNAQTIDVVVNATIGSMLRKPFSTLSAVIAGNKSIYSAEFDFQREVYKARPLNGIWGTAPFLHNGSVPTLYHLLQKPEERPREFYVGSREMDPVMVGLQHSQVADSSLFDTTLYGNSNSGHEFGTDLSEDDKWALIEYLKTL